MEYYEYPDYADIMELYVETLTGTLFELRVSPFETVISVKAKIQRLEGIPICQQHLIYRSVELEDDYCLQDYGIMPGTSLKLVLAMRGGPINTRRIPMEDPAIREMAEYMEANKEEIWEKLPGNRQVTLLVFREGDQLNFFRVVDRGDGTLTPLSESLSGGSVHNTYEEDDAENQKEISTEQAEENDATMNKMKQLKAKMENLSISKKKQKIPRPPSGVRPKSSARRPLPSSKKNSKRLNKNDPLPPLGTIAVPEPPSLAGPIAEVTASSPIACRTRSRSGPHIRKSSSNENNNVDNIHVHKSVQSANIYNLRSRSKSRLQDSSSDSSDVKTCVLDQSVEGLTKPLKKIRVTSGRKSVHHVKDVHRVGNADILHQHHPPPNPRTLENLRSANLQRSLTNLAKSLPQHSSVSASDVTRPETSSQKIPSTLPSGQDLKSLGAERMKLRTADARMMTELVNQANREGKINNIVRTGHREGKAGKSGGRSHSRISSGAALSRAFNGSASIGRSGHPDRISTPETRSALISAHSLRGRLSGGRDRIAVSPSHRLPPVPNTTLSPKKKSSKRCFLCNKRTGLASSYQCRCGHNFCATHRYAEAHNCGYDYKTEGRKLLEQSNPIVSAPKLPKI